jgi:hypothetical protein
VNPHACPVEGCTVTVPDDRVACHEHWAQIPQQAQARIAYAWEFGLISFPDAAAAFRAELDVQQIQAA